MRPFETHENMELIREHTRKDASQTRRKVSYKSKVMVKPATHFNKIHTYLYKKFHTGMRKQTDTYIIRVNKLDEIQ